MKRNLKALGLALVAALAMSAVAASAAQATNEFNADKYPVALTGEQEHGENLTNTFLILGGSSSVECTEAKFEGTAEKDETTLTLEAEYIHPGCETSAGTSASVDMNSCDYTFDALAHTGTHQFDGQAAVDCATEGDSIEVTIPETSGSLCIIHVPPQTGLGTKQGGAGSITYTNITNEGDDEVTVDVDITEEITYTVTKESIFCPLEAGEHHDGTYHSQAIVKGYEKTGRHVNGHEETQTHNNTQVGVRVQTP